MKSLAYICVIVLACFLLVSCNDSKVDAPTNALESSKTEDIQRGEPILFTFQADSLSHPIDWEVTPTEKVNIQNLGRKAQITFENAGNYTVLATNSVTTQRVYVTVDSSVYVRSGTTVTDSLAHVSK